MRHYVQGLIQAVDSTMSGISQVVEDADEQRIQHFISNSPWDHEPLVEHIA
jgi:SRSO17 transposase